MNKKEWAIYVIVCVLIVVGCYLILWTGNHRTRMPEVSGLSWNAAKGCYDPTDKDWAPALLHPDVTEGDCEHGCVVAHTTTLQFEDCLKQCADAPQ